MNYTVEQLASYIDYTLLKAIATEDDIKRLCDEAIEYKFYAICINPCYVRYAKEYLTKCGIDNNVKVCTVIGFPLGANATDTKIFETRLAIEHGADEVDMVINIGELKKGNYDYVKKEIKEIVDISKNNRVLTKVIIETALLNEDEKVMACKLVLEAGADFVKTSTGFNGGATVQDIQLMKSVVGTKVQIKASGGIKEYNQMLDLIESGATRVGTSAGIAMMKEAEKTM